MKKLVLFFVTTFATYGVWAEQFVVDNIRYTITDDGKVAFSGPNTRDIRSITIPSSVTYNEKIYNVTSIGENACYYSTRTLISVTIPNSVTTIGNCAFDGCSSLTSITISNSATSIGEHAFDYCNLDHLTSIIIPQGLDIAKHKLYFIKNNIKYYVLNNHTVAVGMLDYEDNGTGISDYSGNIIIPTSITAGTTFTVTSIDDKAFIGSTATSVTIPNTVTTIGKSAFFDCANLKSITCLASTPPNAYSDSFTFCKGNLYVPCESKKKYAASTGWSSFSNIMCGSTSVSEFFNATVVTIANNQILVNGEAPAFVITVAGQKIANANLKSGVYFVVADGEMVKVMK